MSGLFEAMDDMIALLERSHHRVDMAGAATIVEARRRITQLEIDLAAARDDMFTAKTSAAELRRELAAARAEADETIRYLERELDSARDRITVLAVEHVAARAEVERLRGAIESAMEQWEIGEERDYILAGLKDALDAAPGREAARPARPALAGESEKPGECAK